MKQKEYLCGKFYSYETKNIRKTWVFQSYRTHVWTWNDDASLNLYLQYGGLPQLRSLGLENTDLVEDYPILEEARKVASQIVATPNWREHPDWHLLSLYLEKKEHLD